MIKVSAKKKEIQDTMWSVFTSFGFCEVENGDGLDKAEKGKYCYFDKNEAAAINCGFDSAKAKAEAAAVCIETALVCGMDEFKVTVGDIKVFELLDLFGFEKIIFLEEGKEGFSAVCGDIEFAKGSFEGHINQCVFDMEKFMEGLENAGVDMSEDTVSSSLIFAEKNAEGIAYDVAYNLRVNGCIVEYYNEDGDIESACRYADKIGMGCVLRAYADGKLQMKDLVKNEITETTAADFLGYYEEENEECDCGCGHDHEHGHHHHHGEDCDCCGH